MTRLHYSLETAIEERALQSEGNRLVAWSGLQTGFVERTPGKDASAGASTEHGIEAARLCAFSLPGSPLDRHSAVGFPLRTNDAG